MSLTGRVNTHIYQISTGLREPPPPQGITAPSGGSVTPLGNLLGLLLALLVPVSLVLVAFTYVPPVASPTIGMVTPAVQTASPLAFTGAVGYGVKGWSTICDDSVRYIPVTNTNATGAGSYSAAWDSAAVGGNARKIIGFEVTGSISLSASIDPDGGLVCVYVAGQTAPVRVRVYNHVFEVGDTAITIRYLTLDNHRLFIQGGQYYTFDHLDSRFSHDRVSYIVSDTTDIASASEGEIHDVTVSHSLLSGGENVRHSMWASGPDNMPPTSRISAYRNVFMHGDHRMPLINADSTELINNIGWNWKVRGFIEVNHEFIVDMIANRAKPGQATAATERPYLSLSLFSCEPAGGDGVCSSRWYLYGNIYGNNLTDITKTGADMIDGADQGIACYGDSGSLCAGAARGDTIQHGDTTIYATRQAGPSPDSVPINFDIRSGLALEDSILDFVGNTALIDSLGFFVYVVSGDSVRDTLSSRLLQEYIDSSTVYTGDSIPFSSRFVAADLPTWTVPTDTDGGGVPDAYEDQCGMDKTSAADDITDDDGNGYSNIEEWVNGNNELGQRPSWTDNSDNEEWFVLFRDRGAGKVTVDSVAPNITAYDDVDGRPGDIYYVVAKNVNFTSDTLLVGTARCSGQ